MNENQPRKLDWLDVGVMIVQHGLPFVTELFQNQENNTPVTFEAWKGLLAKIATPGEQLIPKRPEVPA